MQMFNAAFDEPSATDSAQLVRTLRKQDLELFATKPGTGDRGTDADHTASLSTAGLLR